MRKYVFIMTFMALTGCSSSDHKSARADACKDGEMHLHGACLSEEQQQRIGLKCDFTVVTGSRLPVKQCTTAVQRAAAREAARDMVDRMQQQGQAVDGQE